MIIVHALIAIVGLAVTTLAYFKPSQTTLRIAYGLAGATLATGTYLVVMSPAHLVQACISGIIYFSFVTFGIVAAQKKLAVERVKND